MSSAASVSSATPSAMAGWTAGTWTIDPAHTVVAFAARHLMSRVRGTFSQVNGKIVTVDAQSSVRSALAIRGGRIAALGTDADIRRLAGPATRVIDLQGRTVIPGLIDSHMHATRAALSFSTEVNWIGATSLAEGLTRLHEASLKAKPGAWLIVVTPAATLDTFSERRRPTQAELVAAAPNHPVYVQLGYGWAMLTPLAPERRRRRHEQHHRAVRPPAEADLRRAGGGNEAVLP